MSDTTEETVIDPTVVDQGVESGGGEKPLAAFAALGLSAAALNGISAMGFLEPTPIQSQTLPLLLAGRDVVAQAPTGTGKTAAYGLPIVEQFDQNLKAPQAIVIVPTRELAIQVAAALTQMGKFRHLVVVPIYGGQPYDRQLRALERGVQVIVGTPGRLMDHLRRGTLKLDKVRVAVLDEADEMLDMGFIEDIEAILAELPTVRQSALFSATIPPRIAALAERYLHNPEQVRVDAREAIAPRVRQVYYEVPGTAKVEALARILDMEDPGPAIIFVRTRRDAEEVTEHLSRLGHPAQAIHGEVNQQQRERVLDRFRAGHTKILVATDVAARGLDIPDVSHVINFDLPLDTESYVHRIGRTGRAGREGEALTLVTPREVRRLRIVEHAIHRRLQRRQLPTNAEIAARRRASFRKEVLEVLDAGELDPFVLLVQELAGSRDPTEIAAAAFKMAAQAHEARRPGQTDVWNSAALATTQPTPEAFESALAEDHAPGEDAHGIGPRRPRHSVRSSMPSGTTLPRLMLRLGRQQGVRPADLVGAIVNETEVLPQAIGDIDIYDTFSFIELPESVIDVVRIALNRTTIRGQKADAIVAQPGEGRQAHHPYESRDWGNTARRPRAGMKPGPGARKTALRDTRPRPKH